MLTIERPRVSSPPPPPAEPGDGEDGGGDGGGGGRWGAWLLALGLAGLALFGAFHAGRFAISRPLPVLLALLAALLGAARSRGRMLEHSEAFAARSIGGGIAGGVIGEVLHYVVVGLPPTVPRNPIWWVVGAGGIGGAIGVATGICVLLAWPVGYVLWGAWRGRGLT